MTVHPASEVLSFRVGRACLVEHQVFERNPLDNKLASRGPEPDVHLTVRVDLEAVDVGGDKRLHCAEEFDHSRGALPEVLLGLLADEIEGAPIAGHFAISP